MGAVMQILRYLKEALGKWLISKKKGHHNVKGYTYADWACNILDMRSMSRYFTFVGVNLVTWHRKNVLACFVAEAEYQEKS